MLSIIVLLIVFTLSFLLVLFGGKVLLQKLVDKAVGQKHRHAQKIIETGVPPEEWFNGVSESDSAKNRCLNKLTELIKYFKKTNIITDEETRDLLLKKLNNVYRQWQNQVFTEIINEENNQADCSVLPSKQMSN